MTTEENKKWSRDYQGFESIMDFDTDMHIEDALDAITPNPEWTGTIRITFEYIPDKEDENQLDEDWSSDNNRLAESTRFK